MVGRPHRRCMSVETYLLAQLTVANVSPLMRGRTVRSRMPEMWAYQQLSRERWAKREFVNELPGTGL